jgi:hypothetical protein
MRFARCGIERTHIQHHRAVTQRELLKALYEYDVTNLERIHDHAKARRVRKDIGLFKQQRARQTHEGAIAANQPRDRAIGNAGNNAAEQGGVGVRARALAIEHQLVGKKFFVAIQHRAAHDRQQHVA